MERLENRRMLAGPYAPAAKEVGSTAIAKEDPRIVAWASAVDDYSPGSNVDPEFQTPAKAIGPAEGTSGDVASLGRGGQITLTFDSPIRDGLGADFAVFENSFSDTFLELGFVEVSSDGVNFFRFPSDSLTPAAVDSYGSVDPTNIRNFAGKYRQGFGTPFDLEELAAEGASLDTSAVTHVRLIDVVGNGSSLDATGDPIYDPFPTVGSAGLDVDAVGVVNQVDFASDVVTFEDVGSTLGPSTAFSGPVAEGTKVVGPFGGEVTVGEFQVDSLSFNNAYSTDFASWNGWAYSNANDQTTAGFTNQFSSFAGGGANGSPTFGLGFPDQGTVFEPPTISREADDQRRFDSLMVTNTTYAALSMLSGDSFAKKFGGTSGNDPDFLRLTIQGKDDSNASIGTVEVFLADYRFADNSLDYILDEWVEVDLTTIGSARSLEFAISSSDVGPFGMNTPAYFAVDDITLTRPVLQLDLADSFIEESAGETTARVSRADNDTGNAINVNLAAVDPSIATIPNSVTIPAGARFVEFLIQAVDNDLFNGDRSISVEASADGFVASGRTLAIRDDEEQRLSLAMNAASVLEGETLGGTIRRNVADLTSPLEVKLRSTDASLISSNQTVTIAAGEDSVEFTLLAVEDEVDRPHAVVTLSASSTGYVDASQTFSVLDNDQALITLELTSEAFSESQAQPSARFEDLGRRLPPESFYNGSDLSGGFTSGGLAFNNDYNPMFGSWAGWAYSNSTDTTTPGFTNQYSAITGHGAFDSDSFAVASTFTVPTITRDPATSEGFQSIEITNTTYAALSMMQGDAFAKQFGGTSGDDEDFFLLTIEGFDAANASVGFVEFYLADFRFSDNALDYIVNEWTTVDLSAISTAVELRFALSSSDVGAFGMNTPAYFAADHVLLKSQAESPMATLRRNTANVDDAVEVSLRSTDLTELTLPSVVTIPAGASAVAVPLSITDDDLHDGVQSVTLEVAAPLHVTSNRLVSVSDDESPALTLTVLTDSLDEADGQGRAVVHRNASATTQPLAVAIHVDSENQLTIADSLTIPAGRRSVDFAFVPTDNSLVEDDRIVAIQAIASGYSSGSDSVTVMNDDTPLPTLSIEIDRTALTESDAPPSVMLEDIGATIPPESFYNGSDLATGFESGGVEFNNTFNPAFGSWSGWSASNTTDTTSPGFLNQYSAITGRGAHGSATYAVASAFSGGTAPTVTITKPGVGLQFDSLMVTNTTYAALSMREGDAFAKKFGGESGDDPDFFLLTIEGRDLNDQSVGMVEFYLADYRFEDNSLDYIVDQWTAVDVSGLLGATRLEFSLSSSDVGDFGMNTPAYFAVDHLVLAGQNQVVAMGTVSRSDANLDEPLTVRLASDDTTEVSTPDSLVIPSGSRSASFEIRAVDDAVVDGDRLVQVSVAAESHQPDSADVSIEDDDFPVLTLSMSRDSVQESDGAMAAKLLLHRNTVDLTSPLVADLNSDSTDLVFPESVVIPATAASHVVDVGILDNSLLDGHRDAKIDGSAVGLVPGTASFVVSDDDTAGIVLAETSDSTVVDEQLGSDLFLVSLAARPNADVVVDLATDSADVDVVPLRLVFTPNNWNERQVVTVQGVPDLLLEEDESVEVELRVDVDASDAAFADVPAALQLVRVRDQQPSSLRLAEDDQSVYFSDVDSGVRIKSASHLEGVELAANQLNQTIVVEPIQLTRGLVEIDAAGGDDRVVIRSGRFTSLDGGEGHDELVLELEDSTELVSFLDGRVVGFEEIVFPATSTTAQDLAIDTSRLHLVASDDDSLLIRVGVGQRLNFQGEALAQAPVMVGDSLTQVVRAGDITVFVVNPVQWQNVLSRWDVNRSGDVTALDALAIVNEIGRVSDSELPLITSLDQFDGMYFDVSGDGRITSLDALRVINEVARREFVVQGELVFPGLAVESRSPDLGTDRLAMESGRAFSAPAQKLVSIHQPHDSAIKQLYGLEIESSARESDPEEFASIETHSLCNHAV